MTKIKFYQKDGEVAAFEVTGHTEYAESGEDIVCAGISSAVSIVECCINDILKLNATVKVDKGKAKISLKLPPKFKDNEKEICKAVLDAFKAHMLSLQSQYPQYVKVMEEIK